MRTEDPVVTLLADVHSMLEQMNWPTPAFLARALGLTVLSGPVAAINLEPPPTIHLPDHMQGFWRAHTLAHEIAHALLRWRDIDDELLAYYAPECAYSNLEALANHIAGLICFPQPFYQAALRRFDFSPDAMIFMAQSLDAPIQAAMARTVYESESYNRAALLFKRGYVCAYASTFWLEVQSWDYVPDPAARFPGITLRPLSGQAGVVLGTWGG